MMLLTLITAVFPFASADTTAAFGETKFTMGSGKTPDESPAHLVTLSPYKIDRTEVSIQAFEQFVSDGWVTSLLEQRWLAWRTENPDGAGVTHRAGRGDEHPSSRYWYKPDAYCKWKGDAFPMGQALVVGSRGRLLGGTIEAEAPWYSVVSMAFTKRADKGNHGRSRAQRTLDGLYHTTGNVWEWTTIGTTPTTIKLGVHKPTGPSDGYWKTYGIGSFMNLPSYCTCTHREPARPTRVAYTTGFRCAYDNGGPNDMAVLWACGEIADSGRAG